MTRRVLLLVLTAAVLAFAGIGVWRAGHDRPHTLEQRSDVIAAQLGCPTCEAQSVATSNSEIAASMRAEINAQLALGRTPDQIRAWFVDRYGPGVLLEPPRTGVALVLWLAPAALLVAGIVLVGVVVRRRAPAAHPPAQPAARRQAPLVVLAVVMVGVAASLVSSAAVAPGTTPAEATGTSAGPEAWLARAAALEAEQEYARSAEAYRRAVELRPQDIRAQVRLGLVLLEAGEPAQAEAVAGRILAGRPAHPEGLVLLGLAQRARSLPEAAGTLQRFLDVAPAHPAAAEVRRLLTGS